MIDTQYQIGTLVFVEQVQHAPPKPAPKPAPAPEKFPALPPCIPTRKPLTAYTPPAVEATPRNAPWVETVIMAGMLPVAIALLIGILTL